MNFFEKELKKICDRCITLYDAQYVGRACIGRISENVNAKIQFETLLVSRQYETLTVSLIRRDNGVIDSIRIRLKDIISNSNTYIWEDGSDIDWYGYKPTAADYTSLTKAVESYLSVFAKSKM